MGMTIGILGLGGFGQAFVELFTDHPLVDEVVLCERRADVLAAVAAQHRITRTTTDFDELLRMDDVDGVAIYTQRWNHAPFAIQALKAGKHVYSAVPAAVTIAELDELVQTVRDTGLVYALGETSFYRPQNIYCRERFAKGDFGRFVYGEGHYYHDMSHWFYLPFFDANGPEWRRYASVPPIWYPTHSVCHVLGVTMSRFTKVSCFGWRDDHPDGIFREELSAFDNPWSNQSALFRSADGGMARINEFRRCAAGEGRQQIMGTRAAYHEMPNPRSGDISVAQQIGGTEAAREPAMLAMWKQICVDRSEFKQDGTYNYEEAPFIHRKTGEDLSWLFDHSGVEISEGNLHGLPREYLGRTHLGIGRLHPYWRLPKEYIGKRNGHAGSHQFLVHDYIQAIHEDRLPPNHVWLAARLNAPGIVAHESCRREGECLDIPDFGVPPADKTCIDPLVRLRDGIAVPDDHRSASPVAALA
ncbi:MAG: Gfo/Idh/MocA family protein [Planctomycetota bacterium]